LKQGQISLAQYASIDHKHESMNF